MKGLVGVGLLLLSLIGRAAAQPGPASRAFAAGRKLFVAGDYAAAIARFEEARALEDDPAYVYNIAQAYRLMGDCGEAGAYFRAFVRVTEAGAPNRDRAEELAVEMEACAEKAAHPRRGARRSWKRRIGLVTGGAGLAALGAAAALAWRSRDAALELTGAIADGRAAVWTPELEALEERGQRAERLAIGLAIGGAVALVGGGALVVVGKDGAGIGWRF